MRRVLCLTLALIFAFAASASADDNKDTSGRLQFTLNAENWLQTKAPRMTLRIEGSVNLTNAAQQREMLAKIANATLKAEWRLTTLTRTVDKPNQENWIALFEARIPPESIETLSISLKNKTQDNWKITLTNIDYAPSLDEVEAARTALRLQLTQRAEDQMKDMKTHIPTQNFRLAEMIFSEGETTPVLGTVQLPKVIRGNAALLETQNTPTPITEHPEHMIMHAHIVLASTLNLGSEPIKGNTPSPTPTKAE